MTKAEFIANYVPATQQGVARALLPEGDRPLPEWRSLWVRLLNSPSH